MTLTARDFFGFVKFAEANGYSAKDHCYDDMKRRIRAELNRGSDPLEKSMCDDWRIQYNKSGDCAVKYAIFSDDGQTDDELNGFIEDERIPMVYSAYDCTGLWFTASIYWKRAKCGIVVVHRLCRDV